MMTNEENSAQAIVNRTRFDELLPQIHTFFLETLDMDNPEKSMPEKSMPEKQADVAISLTSFFFYLGGLVKKISKDEESLRENISSMNSSIKLGMEQSKIVFAKDVGG